MEDGRYGALFVEMAGFYFGSRLISFALFTRQQAVFFFKILRNCVPKDGIYQQQEQEQAQRYGKRAVRYGIC